MHVRSICDKTPGIVSSLSLGRLNQRYPVSSGTSSVPNLVFSGKAPIPVHKLYVARMAIQEALESGQDFELQENCTGGTYFCLNLYGGVEAVFKPFDEEPYCDHNPKGLDSSKLTVEVERGICPGTSGLREVAAFYLDYNHFAGVPETVLASYTVSNPIHSYFSPSSYYSFVDNTSNEVAPVYTNAYKQGSLQLYVQHECSSEDYGPTMFSVFNVQSIALLDMRLFNLDRHANNLLVTRERRRSPSTDVQPLDQSRSARSGRRAMSICMEPAHRDLHLVPIDHGYSLPACTTMALPEWCWRGWYQSRIELDEDVRAYIRSLCIEQDIALLQNNLPGIEEAALDTLRVTTMWLQLAEQRGLSLYQMSSFFFPEEGAIRSGFQQLVGMYHRVVEQGGISEVMNFDVYLSEEGKTFMEEWIERLR